VAIIMDGNGRWAEARGLSRSEGHRDGSDAPRVRAVEFFANRGVRALTLFAFSSENWQRPKRRGRALFDLFVSGHRGRTSRVAREG
jgi:undecaprenyl diphosphate synthase